MPEPETRDVWVNARGGIVANPSQAEIVRGQVKRRTIPASVGTGPGVAPVGGTPVDKAKLAILDAYAALPQSGSVGWVQLTELRRRLEADGHSRQDVDEALKLLNRTPAVHIAPESNQKTLTAEERAAAVSIGNQAKHLIAIDNPAAVAAGLRGTPTSTPVGTGPGRVPIGGTDADRRAARPRKEGETDRAYDVRTSVDRASALRKLDGHNVAGLRAIARDEGLPDAGTKADLLARLMRVMYDRHADIAAIDRVVNRDREPQRPAAPVEG